MIKNHNSALNQAQRQEWGNDFVKNDFIQSNIDPQDLENWKKRDSSESETSQEDGEDNLASQISGPHRLSRIDNEFARPQPPNFDDSVEEAHVEMDKRYK